MTYQERVLSRPAKVSMSSFAAEYQIDAIELESKGLHRARTWPFGQADMQHGTKIGLRGDHDCLETFLAGSTTLSLCAEQRPTDGVLIIKI